MNGQWHTSSYSNGAACLQARFTKSSHSNPSGSCLEARWKKSTYSGSNGGGCVEARQEGAVQVRDSKQHGTGPVLEFPPDAWQEFIDTLK